MKVSVFQKTFPDDVFDIAVRIVMPAPRKLVVIEKGKRTSWAIPVRIITAKKSFLRLNFFWFSGAFAAYIVIMSVFGAAGLLWSQNVAVNNSLLITEVVRTQTAPAAAGQPIGYAVFIKHSSVTKDHYLVSIPKQAFNITVKDVSVNGAKLWHAGIIETAGGKFINLSGEPFMLSIIKGLTNNFFVGTASAQEVDQEPTAQDQTQTPAADSPPTVDAQSPVQAGAPDDATSSDTQTPVIQPSQDPSSLMQPVPDNAAPSPDIQPPQDSPQPDTSSAPEGAPTSDSIQINYQILPSALPQPEDTTGQPIADPNQPEPAAQPSIVAAPLFTEAEQSSVLVKPLFNDGTTNIAFYIPYGDPVEWVWQSETPAVGDLPFSDYWAPTPAVGEYTAVEYFNDGQQFSCSDLSLQDCIADPHFISKFHFQITNQNDE